MLTEVINEKDVAKTTRLDKKSWKIKLSIIIMVIILIGSSLLIWGFGFKGFLYLEFKKNTKNHYESIVLNLDSDYTKNENIFESDAAEKASDFIQEIESYYQVEGAFKYISAYKVEPMKSKNQMIFVVTNSTFKDIRDNIEDQDKLMSSTFFIYSLEKSHKIIDILYKNGDISRLGEYK